MAARPEFIEHTTVAGERWDHIAYKYYGDAKRIRELIRANRDLFLDDLTPIPLVFTGGITIKVPVVEADQLDAAKLPIWKRPPEDDE